MGKVRGQTLIETLVTLLFVAVGVIALIRFQNYLSYDNNVAQQTADALTLATSKLESLKDFQVLNTTSGYTAYAGITTGSATATVMNTSYNLAWTVTAHTSPTYKTLDVTVSWTDRYGNAQSVELTTNVAGLEPSDSAAIM